MGSKDVQFFPTCRFLQLKPKTEHGRVYLASLLYSIRDLDNTPEERAEYHEEFLRHCDDITKFFFAWCGKLDQLCVITKSVAISGGAAPIMFLAANAGRISNCEDRKPGDIDPQLIQGWIGNHLCLE